MKNIFAIIIMLSFRGLSLKLSRPKLFSRLYDSNRKLWSSAPEIELTQSEYLFGKNPVSFESLGVKPELCEALKSINKSYSTSIQSKVIPTLLKTNDVVISSETGSGKTLSYLVPMIQLCMNAYEERIQSETEEYSEQNRYPTVVILVPNKELATQVVAMGKQITSHLKESGYEITIDALLRNYGTGRWPLRDDCPSILVCTPVIISSFVKGPIILEEELFRSIKHLVIDEADMICSGSYQIELEIIMTALKKVRRGMVRSQDIGAKVIQNEYVHQLHPQIEQTFIKATEDEYESVVSKNRLNRIIQAVIETVPPEVKNTKLRNTSLKKEKNVNKGNDEESDVGWDIEDLLDSSDKKSSSTVVKEKDNTEVSKDEKVIPAEWYEHIPPTMIFANEVQTVQILCQKLDRLGLKNVEFHKALLPVVKETNLKLFQNNQIKVMVCTDFASRGFDLPYVKHVIQAEFASNVVQYLHRIGRCSRAGRVGKATNFYDPSSTVLVQTILNQNEVLNREFYANEEDNEEESISDINHEDDNIDTIESEAPSDLTSTQKKGINTKFSTPSINKPVQPLPPTNLKTDGDTIHITTNLQQGASIVQAFSRRRGLTQKMKKARRDAEEEEYYTQKRQNIQNTHGTSNNNVNDSGYDLEGLLEEEEQVTTDNEDHNHSDTTVSTTTTSNTRNSSNSSNSRRGKKAISQSEGEIIENDNMNNNNSNDNNELSSPTPTPPPPPPPPVRRRRTTKSNIEEEEGEKSDMIINTMDDNSSNGSNTDNNNVNDSPAAPIRKRRVTKSSSSSSSSSSTVENSDTSSSTSIDSSSGDESNVIKKTVRRSRKTE